MAKRKYDEVETRSDDEQSETRSPSGLSNLKKQGAEEEEEEEEAKDGAGAEEEEGVNDGRKEEVNAAEEEEFILERAKPSGEVVRVSGSGLEKKQHYVAFKFYGETYELEDNVLLAPDDDKLQPFVAVIKDIIEANNGDMFITVQWFYRPEEAIKKEGGHWQAVDDKELFYTFYRDDCPAEAVMHKCMVHFIPLNKQLPLPSEHPGFIVQRVYDVGKKELGQIVDNIFEDIKQQEIDMLVAKTVDRLGDLPDLEENEKDAILEEKAKADLMCQNMSQINTSEDVKTITPDQITRLETPKTSDNEVINFKIILSNFKALTGVDSRDKSLQYLLEVIKPAFDFDVSKGHADNGSFRSIDSKLSTKSSETSCDPQKGERSLRWPDDAVSAVTALEQALYEARDSIKYNQKMRTLKYNLKINVFLARRLLYKELEPSVILNMSTTELKDGMTAQEKSTNESQEKKELLQMTNVRCECCNEKRVGIAGITNARTGNRYQLECLQCGHGWSASQDTVYGWSGEPSTIPTSVGTGSAALATAKFEDAQRMLTSPRNSAPDRKTHPFLKPSHEPFREGRKKDKRLMSEKAVAS